MMGLFFKENPELKFNKLKSNHCTYISNVVYTECICKKYQFDSIMRFTMADTYKKLLILIIFELFSFQNFETHHWIIFIFFPN